MNEHAKSIQPYARPPRVSIGMPVFNAERYLEAALDSLLAQTYTDFELIISDNASTDRTGEICREYAEGDPRVRYERQPMNQGANWNFNHVCEQARGELFKWAADDDLQAPPFLEACVAVLDENPDVVACHSRSVRIDTDGQPIDTFNPAGSTMLAAADSPHRRFADVLLSHGWGIRCSGLFRREPLLRSGLFEAHYGWEKIMMADLALSGKFHLIDQTLFFRRDHEGSLSHQVMHSTQDSRRSTMADHYRQSPTLPRLHYLRGYVCLALQRTPNWATALACLGWIGAYLLQGRKLAAMARSLVPRRFSPTHANTTNPTPKPSP